MFDSLQQRKFEQVVFVGSVAVVQLWVVQEALPSVLIVYGRPVGIAASNMQSV